MEGQPKQKKSLFSQRIKQARNQSNPQQPVQSFPKAINIITNANTIPCQQKPNNKQQLHQHKNSQKQQQIIKHEQQQKQEHENQEIKKNKRRFVDVVLGGALKQEEIKKIQRENMESIMGMGEEEVKRYQEMLIRDMPPQFINKFKKGKIKIKKQAPSTMIDQKQQHQPHQQPIQMHHNQQPLQPKQPTTTPSTLGNLQPLLLHIKTHTLSYNHLQQTPSLSPQSQSPLITLHQLKQMLQSQNNQTQIIATKLLLGLCQVIFTPTFQKMCVPVLVVDDQEFHIVGLALDVYKGLVRSAMFQASKTQFRSCWVEIMGVLGRCAELMGGWLRKSKEGIQYAEHLIEFFKGQLTRKAHFMTDDTSSIRASITQALSSLNSPIFTHSPQSLTYLSQNPPKFLQLLSLEQIQSACQQSQQQPNRLPSTLSQIAAYWLGLKFNQKKSKEIVVEFLYPVVLELWARGERRNGMDREVDVFRDVLDHWVCQVLGGKLITDLKQLKTDSIEQQAFTFKCLHITKILSPTHYTALLTPPTSSSTLQTNNETLASILTLLNISSYFNPTSTSTKLTEQQKSHDVQNIQHMLKFIIRKLQQNKEEYLGEIVVEIMVDFLAIFVDCFGMTGETDVRLSYHDINEDILDSTFALLCQRIVQSGSIPKLWSILPQQKLKSLLSSYNYNSFGHYPFTRVLTFLSATALKKTMEENILEQVVSRYPFLFYYAAQEGLYGPKEIYLEGKGTEKMREMWEIIGVGKKIDRGNLFMRYLIKE